MPSGVIKLLDGEFYQPDQPGHLVMAIVIDDNGAGGETAQISDAGQNSIMFRTEATDLTKGSFDIQGAISTSSGFYFEAGGGLPICYLYIK